MDAVAELVGQRHHVARFAEVVQHHVGVDIGDGRVGKGAGGLAGFDARVDPALGEERLGNLAHAGIEGGIGIHHHLAGFVPADGLGLFHGQRRVAVPDLHPVEAEPFAFQLVIAVREFRVGGDHGVAQGLDDLGFHVVGEVARGLGAGHLAPAVDDLFLLGRCVVDAGEYLDVFGEDAGEFAGGHLALGAVLVGQVVEGCLDAEFFALHVEGQPGDGFVKEALPCVAHHAEVVEEFLQFVRELIGFHGADAIEDGLVAGQVGIGGEGGVEMGIRQAVQFQCEEHQRGGEIRQLFLAVRHELRASGVCCELVIAQARIGHDAACDLGDFLVALHAGQQGIGVERFQLAFVIGGEGGAFRLEKGHVGLEFGGVGRCIEIAQIPFGQVAEAIGAGGGVCVANGKGKVEHGSPLVCLFCWARDRQRGRAGARGALQFPRSMG